MVKKKSEPQKGSNLLKLKAKRDKAPETSETTEDTSEGKSTEETTKPSSEQQDSPDEDTVSTTRSPRKQPQPARKEANKTTLEKIKKRPKNKTRVFKEIAKFQKSTNLLIPKAPFLRLVREIMMERSGASRDGGGMRITPVALEALRESSECYLTSVFEDAYLIALHSKRVTLMPRDIELLMQIRHE